MTLPNYLTFIRIFVSPIFLLVYIAHDSIGISATLLPYILLFLLAVSELSDAFDGYLARKYHQVTDFGKILDPMADSISRLSVFLTFTLEPIRVPMLLIFVFLYRDSVVSTLRTICALRGFALAARTSGKIKAIIQAVTALLIVLFMIPHSLQVITTEKLHEVSTWLVEIAAAYTLFSGIDYVYANRQYIAKLLTQPPKEG